MSEWKSRESSLFATVYPMGILMVCHEPLILAERIVKKSYHIPCIFSMPYDSAYNRQYDWGFCTEGKIKANCKTYCLRSDNPYTGMTVTQVGLSRETFQWNTYSLSSANVSLIVRVLLIRNHWRKNRRTPLMSRCPRNNFTYASHYLYENFG